MTFKASKSLSAQFMQEAIRRYPEEACGVIVKKGKKQEFVPLLNTAPKTDNSGPELEFYISEEEFARASDIGEVIAIWHTHPDKTNQPSDADRLECENLELPWLINGITKTDEGEWHFTETFLLEPSGFVLDYLGRPYHYGLIDCYSILRDYYMGEYGIALDRMRHCRETRFWEFNNPVIEGHYEELGFERVYDTEPREGDVFLIQVGGKVANHVAIYIGDDMILHHCENRLSSRNIYGGYWQKHTVAHLRHPEVEKHGTDKGDS